MQWISWCTERQSDLISGPIEYVINFQAHLHSQGYQYHSLNSVMLLALTHPSHSADLAKLSLTGLRNTQEGAVFLPLVLVYQKILSSPYWIWVALITQTQ